MKNDAWMPHVRAKGRCHWSLAAGLDLLPSVRAVLTREEQHTEWSVCRLWLIESRFDFLSLHGQIDLRWTICSRQ